MAEIINIGDKLNLGIIKTISREIREIKERVKKLEDKIDLQNELLHHIIDEVEE